MTKSTRPTTKRTDPFGPSISEAESMEMAGPHLPGATDETATTQPQLVYCGAHDTKNPIPCQVWFGSRTVLPVRADDPTV
jgi:hypothetical protein